MADSRSVFQLEEMILPFALLVAVFFALCKARIQGQCQCEAYRKCEETYKPQQRSFRKCLKTCSRIAGDEIPKEYPKCLNQFNHVLSKTMKCSHSSVGSGCTSNESNVLNSRNFTKFEELIQNEAKELAGKVGIDFNDVIEPAQKMNRCLLSCFYPAQNICTSKLKCGLFMPNELRLMDNLLKCAFENDVSKGIMMELATCMVSVTRKSEEETEDEEYTE